MDRRLPLACVLAALLAGPASAQAVKVEFNGSADFAGFRSYAWKDTQEPAPSELDDAQLRQVVERELAARGLAKAEAGRADLLVRYFAKIGKRTRAAGRSEDTGLQPADRRTVVEISRTDELKLILELYTPVGLEPVWSATATEALAPPARVEQQIDQTVTRLLSRYPPDASKP